MANVQHQEVLQSTTLMNTSIHLVNSVMGLYTLLDQLTRTGKLQNQRICRRNRHLSNHLIVLPLFHSYDQTKSRKSCVHILSLISRMHRLSSSLSAPVPDLTIYKVDWFAIW